MSSAKIKKRKGDWENSFLILIAVSLLFLIALASIAGIFVARQLAGRQPSRSLQTFLATDSSIIATSTLQSLEITVHSGTSNNYTVASATSTLIQDVDSISTTSSVTSVTATSATTSLTHSISSSVSTSSQKTSYNVSTESSTTSQETTHHHKH